MSVHDGENATEEALEKVGGYFTVALTVALRATEQVSHRHAEERRRAEQQAELARRRVERQQQVEATAARHQLRDVGSKGWWDKSTDAEIAAGYALARAYGQIDMELAGTAEYMAEEITRRYGVDPEVYVARAEREATELRGTDYGPARNAREDDMRRDKLAAFDFEMARDYGDRWADRDDLPAEAGARIRAHEEAMAADRWVTAAQERIEAASSGTQLTPSTPGERAAAATAGELSRMYGKDWFTREDVHGDVGQTQQVEAAREWARRERTEAAALVAEANLTDTRAGAPRGPSPAGVASGRAAATEQLGARLDGAGISGEARKARLAVDTAQPKTVVEAVSEGRHAAGRPARGPRRVPGVERGR